MIWKRRFLIHAAGVVFNKLWIECEMEIKLFYDYNEVQSYGDLLSAGFIRKLTGLLMIMCC